jgi:hypothetical protein
VGLNFNASRAERGRLSNSQTSFEQFAVAFNMSLTLQDLGIGKVRFTVGRRLRVDKCGIEIHVGLLDLYWQ